MIEELFQRIDVNGDGRIEWSEFNMIVGKLFSRPEHHHRITKQITSSEFKSIASCRFENVKETMDRLVSSPSRRSKEEEEVDEDDIMSIDDDVDTLGEELARHAISEGQPGFSWIRRDRERYVYLFFFTDSEY